MIVRAGPFICIAMATALLTMAAVGGQCAETEETAFALQDWSDTGTPDREGLKRDTWYFVGYQWIPFAILYSAPESVSNWSAEEKKEHNLSTWWDHATHPVIDNDEFYINYVLHPYWGAAYFVRARERGYSDRGSFWYSVLLSSIYEFGVEALAEDVSIQDLIVTPVFGSLLGRYFMRVRHDIRDREGELGYRRTRDKWVWVLTDPLGSLNNSIDRMFGRETHLQIQPYSYVLRRDDGKQFESPAWNEETVIGLEFRLQW